jgi:GT2 family glycosyltransferase
VVAFTDDDAYADPDWIRHLLAPFDQHPDVVCVTGLVLPAELETAAQRWFEEFGAFDKGFDRVVWRTQGADPELDALGCVGGGGVLFPYSAGVYGSGNNMAFRVDWLQQHGAFDVALGAGTVTRGGEDIDAFLRVMLSGKAIVYEPRALVRHHARGDMDGLRTQMYGYGSGMCAVIVKHFVSSPRGAARILARVPAGLKKLLDPGSDKNKSKTSVFPAELARAELQGYAAGPALYLLSRLRSAR